MNSLIISKKKVLASILCGGFLALGSAQALAPYNFTVQTSGWERYKFVDAAGTLIGIEAGTGKYTGIQVSSFAIQDGLVITDINGNLRAKVSPLASTPAVDGAGNVNYGSGSLASSAPSGIDNLAIGVNALNRNTSGDNNVALGNYSLSNNVNGSDNVGVGVNSLLNNTIGNGNTGVGRDALLSNTSGNYNTAYGLKALFSNTTGNNNAAFGVNSLYGNTTGVSNTAVGTNSLQSSTTGNSNVALGNSALESNLNGSFNTSIGVNSLLNNMSGNSNVAIGIGSMENRLSGDNNTAIGINSLQNNNSGLNNVAVGGNALSSSTAGSGNIAIGYNAQVPSATGNNQLSIANFIYGTSNFTRLGIATSAPRAVLDVNGEIVATPRVTLAQDLTSTSPTWHIDNFSDRFRIFRQPNISLSGSEYLTVINGGNVGIGTQVPNAKLTVGNALGGTAVSSTFNTNAGDLGISAGNQLNLANIGFNSSNATSLGIRALRTVNGTTYTSAAIGIGMNVDSTVAGNNNSLWFHNNGNIGIGTSTPTTKLEISGDVTATAYYYSSDRRLKSNIRALDNSLEKIIQLNGYSFDWNATGKKDIGVIAQEVEAVFPEAVRTNPITGMKAVEYGNLVAPLIEALKTQQHQIDTQSLQIQELQKKISQLQK